MNKRSFLKITAISGVGMGILTNAMAWNKSDIKQTSFALPALPYAYDALKSHIDEMTMRIHHTKHFQGYTNKLNAAIKGTAFEGKTIEQVLQTVGISDTAVRNNGGGYYNHSIFFASLSPKPRTAPEGQLLKEIKAGFGSFNSFKEQFSKAAGTVFGSGWAWLVADNKGKLSIMTTSNQDNPLMGNIVKSPASPLMGIDVWEHAYYLKYQNRRSEYIQAFWNVLDWSFVDKQYEAYSRN